MQHVERVEKRRHIRLQAELPVKLLAEDQHNYRVQCVALSIAGMLFLCDNWDAQQLVPKSRLVSAANSVKVTAQFYPTLKRDVVEMVTVESEIIEQIRVSENSYQLHLRFGEFTKGSKEALQDFINKLL